MLGTLAQSLAQNVKRTYLSSARKSLFTVVKLAVMTLLLIAPLFMTPLVAVVAAPGCTRETIYLGTRIYGGRQYDDFVSCGSSAGNFAYTCAEGGGCYENPEIDPGQYCRCDDIE